MCVAWYRKFIKEAKLTQSWYKEILYRIDTYIRICGAGNYKQNSVLHFIANYKSSKKNRREIQLFCPRNKRNFSWISAAGSFFLALIIANETESAGFRMPMSGVRDRKSARSDMDTTRAIELWSAYTLYYITSLRKSSLVWKKIVSSVPFISLSGSILSSSFDIRIQY